MGQKLYSSSVGYGVAMKLSNDCYRTVIVHLIVSVNCGVAYIFKTIGLHQKDISKGICQYHSVTVVHLLNTVLAYYNVMLTSMHRLS